MDAQELRGIGFDEYAAIDAVNWSTLKCMVTSPALYRHRCDNPREDTLPMLIGRAIHAAVLEPDTFDARFAVWGGAARRGKAYDEFCFANEDKTVLRADEYERVKAVADAVAAHPVAAPLIYGETEHTLVWTDEETGIRCKARLDFLTDVTLGDLKSTKTVDARAFGRTAADMLYHGQMAFYARGVAAVRGCYPVPRIIAVEAEPPHDVAVFRVPDDAMAAGDAMVAEALSRVAYYTERDEWPGRYESEQELLLPPWTLEEYGEGGGLGITIGGERA